MKEWSIKRIRVPLWYSPKEESEYGGGYHFWCFDHKIVLFYAEHLFWIFRWWKEYSTMRLRLPFWLSFGAESWCGTGRCLQYLEHKILLLYAEHVFWIYFNPKQVLRRNIVPLGVHHPLHNWSTFKPKIDIFEIFIRLWLYYYKWCYPKMNSPG